MSDYERALVSCLLSKPKFKSYVANISKQHFSDEISGIVFDAIDIGDTFPQISKKLTDVISFADLMEWQELIKLPTSSIVQYYGMFVIEDFKKRRLQDVSKLDFDTAFDELNKLRDLNIIQTDEVSTSDEFLKDLEKILRREPDTSTKPTGFSQIDEMIRGFRNSELIILGGRPAMGKSTMGLNIAYNMAMSGQKVLFFSLEMAKKELHLRLVKLITGIENIYKLTDNQFSECVRISRFIENELSMSIYDKADQTIEGIRGMCQMMRNDIDAVFIDHISILKSSKFFKSRYEEISDVSRQLKVLAKEIDRPVIALCQLNRGVEQREVKLPTMADLRDSGSIEQDADMICFIHRPEYYTLQRNEEPTPEERGKAILSICKNRRGGVGCVEMRFNPKIPTFY